VAQTGKYNARSQRESQTEEQDLTQKIKAKAAGTNRNGLYPKTITISPMRARQSSSVLLILIIIIELTPAVAHERRKADEHRLRSRSLRKHRFVDFEILKALRWTGLD
jgi:hypothetical protein